jgi:CheY-like chemotaxis protein
VQLIPGDAKRLERVVRRVLVAEDDEDTRTLLAWGLRLHGYEVVEVKSGTELFEVLTMCLNAEEQMPDVILSDIRMPGFSGLEVLGCIDRAELGVPFILMTAFSDEETKKRGENEGAAAFLAKPFEFEKLLAAIDESLGIPPKEPEPSSEATVAGGRTARPVTSTRSAASGRPPSSTRSAPSAQPSSRPSGTRVSDRPSGFGNGARGSDRPSARPPASPFSTRSSERPQPRAPTNGGPPFTARRPR